MKRILILMMIAAISAAPVFSQNAAEEKSEISLPKKHQFLDQYFGVNTGVSGMKTDKYGILTIDFGVNYNFYIHEWVSLNTGFILHTELYKDHNLLTNKDPMVTPLCFTIPFGIYFNFPKIEWLYTGASVGINIPIADPKSPKEKNVFSGRDVFISLPIDLGFDFIKPGAGGSRAFIRVTPAFYKGGIAVPVGFVWQIYNWKVYSKKVDVETVIPNVEVKIPASPAIIIFN